MRARRWSAWVWCAALLSAVRARAVPSCPPEVGARCRAAGSGYDDYIFYVDENKLSISFKEGAYFAMSSRSNLTLEHPALPRFGGEVRVDSAVLEGLPVPPRAYADVLRALGVRVAAAGSLAVRRAPGRLAAPQLARLPCRALALADLRLAPDAFALAPPLRRLRLDAAAPADPARLPASLEELELVSAGVALLDRAALARFPNLTTLVLRDDDADVLVEPVAPLEKLALQARAVRVSAALPDSLAQLTLQGWADEEPAPWRACAGLRSLKVLKARARRLAGGWLARCAALRELLLRAAPLESVAPDALRGAALERLTISRTPLRALPPGLLDAQPALVDLDLSDNRLEQLQGSLFADLIPHKKLATLDASRNRLTGEVFEAVSALRSLRALRLSHNALGDACAGGAGGGLRGASRLDSLPALADLALRRTGASRLCADWHQLPLARLDLAQNRFTELTFSDLQFKSAVRVDLTGNNVTRLLYSYRDYEALRASPGAYCQAGAAGEAPPLASRASVLLDAALRCDCALGWAARALQACPAHVRLLPAPRCSNGSALLALRPDELLCDERCAAPPPCRCQRRTREAAPRDVLRVTCARANLSRLPALPAAPRAALELRLPHNRLAPRAGDLPPDLLELDLRHNRVDSAGAAAALLAPARRVLLAGNPLRCDCGAAARELLEPRRHLLADYELAVCGAAPPPECAVGAGAWLPLLALPLAGAALLGGCALRPGVRARVKALLRGAGREEGRGEERGEERLAGGERPYDVFVSYSHRDQAVADALLARLERGGRRACVHQRDWAPGGWIPAQIAASVRRSRATLALVSAHFLRSRWARAEFREALGAAPRLLVVLLDEPARLPLDAELRGYLARNTYVRWGDPWFWRKLLAALPPPRPPLRLAPAALETDLRPAPAALETDLRPAPAALETDLRPAPAALETDLRPAPAALVTDLRPAPAALETDLRPAPAALETDLRPAPAALETDLRPAPAALETDLRPAPAALETDLRPAPAALETDLRPAPAALVTDLRPAPAALETDLRPVPAAPQTV